MVVFPHQRAAMVSIKALRKHLDSLIYLKGLDIDLLRDEDNNVLILGNGVRKTVKTLRGGKSFLTRLNDAILCERANQIALKRF